MSLIKCPECGKKVNSTDNICNSCGHPLNKTEKNKNKSKKNLKLYLVFIVVAIILIVVFCMFFSSKKKESISKLYVACFENNNICIEEEELEQMFTNTTNTDINSLVFLLDEALLKNIYPNESNKAQKYANEILDSYKEQFDDEEMYLQALSYYGYSSAEEARRSFLLTFYQNKAIEDYARKQITQEKIEKYYENKIRDSIEVSHILINPNNDGLEKAKNIIKSLDNGGNFSELAKQNSYDLSTKNKGGYLGYIDKDDVEETFYEAALNLKINEYSKEPILTDYGYHIILKTSESKKPTLKEVEEKIISKLIEELMSFDAQFGVNALIELRNEYGLKIYDDTLKTKYDKYLENTLSNKVRE